MRQEFNSLPSITTLQFYLIFFLQRRNKPKEAPKMQKLAPFFLSNINGAQPAQSTTGSESRILDSSSTPFAMPLTPWAEKLKVAKKPEECNERIQLKS